MKSRTSGVSFGRIVFVLVFATVFATALAAQIPVGTILGIVKDASGGAVAGATVTATNVDTNQTRTETSGPDGSYRFSSLPVGHYSVKTEASGFKTSQQTGIVLDVSTEVTLNPVLEVGAATQEVTVTGEAPLVNTTTSNLGGLVNEDRMADLPLNGRNYVDLTLMQAGVTQHMNIGTGSGLAGTWFSSNGAPYISNYFTLDGSPLNNQYGGGGASYAGTTLGVDGIREYKVITNTFSAEYGMTMGSQVVIVSKGGSNQFHGDAFEYLRNNSLDARNYFDTPADSPGHRLPPYQRNNFGGSFGGPIQKNKTFFYGVYEGLRQNLGFSAFDNVLNAGCHGTGVGSETITPAECPNLTQVGSGNVTTPPPGSPGLLLLSQEPLPSPGQPANCGLTTGTQCVFSFPSTGVTSVNYGQMRVDHTFSDSDSMFVRYTIDNASQTSYDTANLNAFTGTAFPGYSGLGTSRSQWLTLVETHIFNPSLLNTARISYSRTTLVAVNVYQNSILDPGGPLSIVGGGLGFGDITIGSGLTALGPSGSLGPPASFHNQNLYTGSDDWNYTEGKNAFKFGFLYNRFGQAEQSQFNAIGTVTFASANYFIEGLPSGYTSLTPGSNLNKYFMYNTLGFYGQDDWRVNARLTLNLGLRWEFMTTPKELSGNQSRFLDILDPHQTWSYGPVMNNTSLKNVSPRFGFAWDIFGNGKTSIRGGTGMFYDIGNLGEYFDQEELTIPPYSTASAYTFPTPYTTPLTLPVQYPAGAVGSTIHTVDYHYFSPHLFQYNMTLEQQLPGSASVQLSYVGTRGWNLNSPESINYVNPYAPYLYYANGVKYWPNSDVGCLSVIPTCRVNYNYGAVSYQTTEGISWFNSLQIVVNKRMTQGLQFQAAYTYAQALDTATGALVSAECSSSGADAGIDPLNLAGSKGKTCFNVTHNLRFNLIYHLPNLKSEGFVSKLTNGWWTSSIVSVQSGYPFTPTLSAARNNGLTADRASLVTAASIAAAGPCTTGAGTANPCAYTPVPYNAKTVITGNPNMWYNPNMFQLAPTIPCPGTTATGALGTAADAANSCQTYGNATRDMLTGPGLGTWNFSLVKDTGLKALGEAGNIEFRAEFFNLLNRANFGMPSGAVFAGKNSDIGPFSEAPQSSQISTTATTPRQIQLALKVIF